MNKADLFSAVRKGSGKFRVDDVIISTGLGDIHGRGTLELASDRFRFDITLEDSATLPEARTGITTRKDFWKIEGIIDHELPFTTFDLPRNPSQSWVFGQPCRSSVQFAPNYIDLAPVGMEGLTKQEIQQLQRQADAQTPGSSVHATTPQIDSDGNLLVSFCAILCNFELLARNGGTEVTQKNAFLGESGSSKLDTFQGAFQDWEYGLIQRDGDLHVHFISTKNYTSKGEDADRRFLHAFLQALAFTHAQHPWPLRSEHRRDSKLIRDRLHLHGRVADSPHAPFSRRLAESEQARNGLWKFDQILASSFGFFSSGSNLASECENILHLMREATSPGIPQGIRLLCLCALLESLTRVIHAELRLAPDEADAAEFQDLRAAVAKELRSRTEQQEASRRLAAIISSYEPVNIRMQFESVVDHLGLSGIQEMKDLHSLWRDHRNPVSHRLSARRDSERSFRDDPIAESRFAGAINCFILKAINYTGLVRLSAFEDKYVQI